MSRHVATDEVRTIVDLREHADGRARPVGDASLLRRDRPAQRAEQVALARAVRADQADALAVVHLVGERQEQATDRHVDELHHAARRVAAAQADLDVLVRHGRRRWTRGDELLPAGLRRVGLRRVLEVLRGALLHDLHVLEQPALLVVPALQVVAELLLTPRARLGEGAVRAAVDPAPGPLDDDDLRRHALEQRPVVADHQDRRPAVEDLVLEPAAGRDVEVVVRLVEQQHVRPRREQQVEDQPLALAAGQLRHEACGDVVDLGLDAALQRGLPPRLELVAAEVAPVGEGGRVAHAVVVAGQHRPFRGDERPSRRAQRARRHLDQHLPQGVVGSGHPDVLGHAEH